VARGERRDAGSGDVAIAALEVRERERELVARFGRQRGILARERGAEAIKDSQARSS
jgi:hypothetical protein